MTKEQIDAIIKDRYSRAYNIISEFGGSSDLMIAVAQDIEKMELENRKRAIVKGEVGGFYDKERQAEVDAHEKKIKDEEEAWDNTPGLEVPKERNEPA